MKKAVALLIALVLVVALVLPTFAGATVSGSTATGKKGDKVTVTFTISGNPGFASAKFTVSYDKTALKLTKLSGSILQGANNIDEGLINGAASENITDNGTLFTAQFEILEGAEEGKTYPITISADKFNDEELEAVEIAVAPGAVTVEKAEEEQKEDEKEDDKKEDEKEDDKKEDEKEDDKKEDDKKEDDKKEDDKKDDDKKEEKKSPKTGIAPIALIAVAATAGAAVSLKKKEN